MPRKAGRILAATARRSGSGACSSPPKSGPPVLLMRPDEFTHLVDGPKAIQIAFALRVAPGEKAVAAEQHTVAARIIFDRLLELKSKFETGPLPGEPDDFPAKLAVELLQLLLCHWRLPQWRWPNPDEDDQRAETGRKACSGVSIEAATRFWPKAEMRIITRPSRLHALRRDTALSIVQGDRETPARNRTP